MEPHTETHNMKSSEIDGRLTASFPGNEREYGTTALNAVRCPYVTYVRNAGRGRLSNSWLMEIWQLVTFATL